MMIQMLVALGVTLVSMFGLSPAALAGEEPPLKNEDVVALVEAKVPEATIILSIQASEVDFDLSAPALISLSKQGIPQSIIAAMLEADAAEGSQLMATRLQAPAEESASSFDVDQVLIKHDGKTVVMRYVTPKLTPRARALGFGGAATYAALEGKHAGLRVTDAQPAFELAIPTDVQPDNYFTLVRLAVRRNKTREIALSGAAFASIWTGLPKDRIIAVEVDEIDVPSGGGAGHMLFRIRPQGPLEPGEYALIVHMTDVAATGNSAVGPGYGRVAERYFDFGIDE